MIDKVRIELMKSHIRILHTRIEELEDKLREVGYVEETVEETDGVLGEGRFDT